MLSCHKFGLAYDIKVQNKVGSWLDTSNEKIKHILTALINYRQKIVWLDADCEVMRYPDMLFADYDLAVFNWHADTVQNKFPFNPDLMKCSGGVVGVDYSAPSMEMMVRWLSEKSQERPDDQILDDIINENKIPLKILNLPRSYNRMTSIFDETKPIINHFFTNGNHGNS